LRQKREVSSRIIYAQVPIIAAVGESIAEATVVDVKVKSGEEVAADQESLTSKRTRRSWA